MHFSNLNEKEKTCLKDLKKYIGNQRRILSAQINLRLFSEKIIILGRYVDKMHFSNLNEKEKTCLKDFKKYIGNHRRILSTLFNLR